MAHILRTRFAKDIVAEFLPPARKTKHDKVIIICDGMPSVPKKHKVLEFFSKKGYWVFHPRYRGSWESGGSFLKLSPHQDILDVIDNLSKAKVVKDLFSNEIYKIAPIKICVMGGSFGGPAALLVSKNKKVDKVIARAPVVDWRDQKTTEPLGPLLKFVRQGFGEGYRVKTSDWRKLQKGIFYNPAKNLDKIDPRKVLMIQAQDDKIVSAATVKKFAKDNNIPLILLKTGGHISLAELIKPHLYRKIQKFLNS